MALCVRLDGTFTDLQSCLLDEPSKPTEKGPLHILKMSEASQFTPFKVKAQQFCSRIKIKDVSAAVQSSFIS